MGPGIGLRCANTINTFVLVLCVLSPIVHCDLLPNKTEPEHGIKGDEKEPMDVTTMPTTRTNTDPESMTMTTNYIPESAYFDSKSTNQAALRKTIFPLRIDACRHGDIVLTGRVQLHVNTTYNQTCKVNVTTPNNTGISVHLLQSTMNPYTYFYVEILEHLANACPNHKYVSVDISGIPCKTEIFAHKFTLHFRNTDELLVDILAMDVKVPDCSQRQDLLQPGGKSGELLARGMETGNSLEQVRWTDDSLEQGNGTDTSFEAELETGTIMERCNMSGYSDVVRYIVTDQYNFIHVGLNLSLKTARYFADCPSGCSCSIGFKTWKSNCHGTNSSVELIVYEQSSDGISFHKNGLHWVEDNTFKGLDKIESLSLTLNSIHSLPKTLCNDLPNLKALILNRNRFVTLTADVFKGRCAEKLQLLDLAQNRIVNISRELLVPLTQLTVLELWSNDISVLSYGIFDSLANLNWLRFFYNQLSELPHNIFHSLVRMEKLDLFGNTLSMLPDTVFGSLGRLKWLILSYNHLSMLPSDLFKPLGKLERLWLSRNKLYALPSRIFESQERLKLLALHGNDLSSLSSNLFASLVNLQILGLDFNNFSSLYALNYGCRESSGNRQDRTGHSFNIFRSLELLISLNLGYNSLTDLCQHVFSGTTDLATLELQYNDLVNLHFGVFTPLTKLVYLDLHGNALNSLADFSTLVKLRVLDIGNNYLNSIEPSSLMGLKSLEILCIQQNELRILSPDAFVVTDRLIVLDLSHNSLTEIQYGSFSYLKNLQTMNLKDNFLNDIDENTLAELVNLKSLDLSNNKLTNVRHAVLQGLDQIKVVNVSNNSIQMIDPGVFKGPSSLHTVDLRKNKMLHTTADSFNGSQNLSILVDTFATCCFVHKNEPKCISQEPQPEYLTCKRMLQNVFLRISVFVLGLSAIVCNVFAIYARISNRQTNKVQTLLITQLSLSDLIMGISMLLLAFGDVYYAEYFPYYSHAWRNGFVCKLTGALSMLSSEGSVCFVALISIDRFMGVKYPFSGRRLGTKSTRVCIGLIWLFSIFISVIPFILVDHHEGVFSVSEVCIGIPIVRRNVSTFETETTAIPIVSVDINFGPQHTDGQFQELSVNIVDTFEKVSFRVSKIIGSELAPILSIVIFIGFNLFCFAIVAFCYIQIFVSATKSSNRSAATQVQNEELRMAVKMFAIVFTDFCCWVPLCVVCILTQWGVIQVSPEMYAWTVGLILPINSSINPFLYTISGFISNRLERRRDNRNARMNIQMENLASQ